MHDLNVLHDGSDIYGPLRLQLRSVVPRFIVRYHLLQDQITRLNLAVEAREDFDAVPSEEQGVSDGESASLFVLHRQRVNVQLQT